MSFGNVDALPNIVIALYREAINMDHQQFGFGIGSKSAS